MLSEPVKALIDCLTGAQPAETNTSNKKDPDRASDDRALDGQSEPFDDGFDGMDDER